jgi:hypothetical protein
LSNDQYNNLHSFSFDTHQFDFLFFLRFVDIQTRNLCWKIFNFASFTNWFPHNSSIDLKSLNIRLLNIIKHKKISTQTTRIQSKFELKTYQYNIDIRKTRHIYWRNDIIISFGECILERTQQSIIVEMITLTLKKQAFFYQELNDPHDHINKFFRNIIIIVFVNVGFFIFQ